MATKPQTPKGFRDFLPEEARLRESVITTLKEVFSLYGFSPLETPAIEYASTLLDKYGEEADKLIYLFQDRGGREVGLRYDLTVPLARVVASYQNELPIPFKRYQVAPVWRADKPQAGRFREFWQADIDTVGSKSLIADVEVIACILSCMERLGFSDYLLLINDRNIFPKLGIEEIQIIRALDKMPPMAPGERLPGKEVVKLFRVEADLSKAEADRLLVKIMETPEPKSITRVKSLVKEMGGDKAKIRFLPALARGLEYYTGIIFELQVRGYENLSIGGGGRYDQLIGKFAGRDLPAVGFSFGIDRLIEALQKNEILTEEKGISAPEVLVTVFNAKLASQSLKVAAELRKEGITTGVYPDEETKLDKQLKYANKRGIPWVVIIGPEEDSKSVVRLRNMESGDEELLTLEDLVKKLG